MVEHNQWHFVIKIVGCERLGQVSHSRIGCLRKEFTRFSIEIRHKIVISETVA